MIYFLRCDGSGLTKIGKATDPVRRVTDIQRMSGAPLRLVALQPGYTREEYAWHCQYTRKRKHGEWFALADGDIPPTHPLAARLLGPVSSIKRPSDEKLARMEEAMRGVEHKRRELRTDRLHDVFHADNWIRRAWAINGLHEDGIYFSDPPPVLPVVWRRFLEIRSKRGGQLGKQARSR